MPECGDTAITVRLAKADDGQRCAEIYLASRRAAFHWQPAGSFVLEDYQRAIEDEEVWVAEIDGVAVGFASIYRPENFVHNLFVDPRWQHRGIGTVLLERACAHLFRPARLKCLAANQGARAFYERNGWVMDSTTLSADEPYVIYLK